MQGIGFTLPFSEGITFHGEFSTYSDGAFDELTYVRINNCSADVLDILDPAVVTWIERRLEMTGYDHRESVKADLAEQSRRVAAELEHS